MIVDILKHTLQENDCFQSSNAHLLTMVGLVLNIKAKAVLELGVAHGNTSTPLLYGAALMGGKLTSVDLNNPINWTCMDELKPFYEFVRGDAIAFLEKCVAEGRKFDLIFVDDWHSYEHVKKELELIDKLISPSGLVLLHDLMARNNQPNYFNPITPEYDHSYCNGEFAHGGPYRAVNELDKDKWEWATIPADHGLTILRKKSGIVIT